MKKSSNILFLSILLLSSCEYHELEKGFYTDSEGNFFWKCNAYGMGCKKYIRVPKVDLSTYEYLEYGYSKDKDSVYCVHSSCGCSRMFTLKEANANSFVEISPSWGKDMNFVYYKGKILDGIDPNNFEVIPNQDYHASYAKNNDHVFYGFREIEIADSKSFLFIKDTLHNRSYGGYGLDINFVYNQDKPIDSCDVKTFVLLNRGYFKDSKTIFYGDKIVQADYKTFAVIRDTLESTYSAKDKYGYFYGGERI